jgi:ligand-binding SRPBCC domain-containing protein
MGEEVTWRGRHFGITQHFTSKITAFEPSGYFQDTMQRGAFKSFVHDHFFTSSDGGTLMKDILAFAAPLGVLGRIAEIFILRRYMESLIATRAKVIKEVLETTRPYGTA